MKQLVQVPLHAVVESGRDFLPTRPKSQVKIHPAVHGGYVPLPPSPTNMDLIP